MPDGLMLTGKELLDRVKELSHLSKTEMVQACGYLTTTKDGKVRTNFTAFYEAILEAKGMSLGDAVASRGRSASYRVKVQANGNLMIGYSYTKKMGWEPNQEFEIKLGRDKITLIPMEQPSTSEEDEEDTSTDTTITSDNCTLRAA